MSPAVVELDEVRRTFGATVAVDSVSLQIAPGEMFGLLGPSGCGKTTLLRLIAGLDRPDRGRVVIAGREVTDEPAHQRPVHTVFQSYALFPRMTVAANVAYGLRAARVPAAEVAERVAEAIALVGLTGKERRRPHQLSGGEQQRVALARALVNRPPVLLLDEPLAALDAHLRHEMQGELRRLQRETNCTFILVTHDQNEAFSLCDRVGVMFAGSVVQVATPDELARRPATDEVARFIGRSSVVDGVWSDGRVDVGGWSLRAEANEHLVDGSPCLAVIRPRQLRLADSGGIAGEITGVAFANDRYETTVQTPSGPLRVEGDEHPPVIGAPVHVTSDDTPIWALATAVTPSERVDSAGGMGDL